MLYTTKYPLELRLAVVEAYHNNVGGYKKLAKIYGLNRDLVRFWVLDRRRKKPLDFEKPIQVKAGKKMIKSNTALTSEQKIKDLQLQVTYYKRLSEILEEQCKDEKKKHAAEQFKNFHQKDRL